MKTNSMKTIHRYVKASTSEKNFLHFLLLIILFMTSSCGYNLSGRGSYLPEHVKKIAIPVFKNNTPRLELEQRITRAVIDTIVKRGKFQIVADENDCDALLEAEINMFNYLPVQFTQEGSADRYEIIITSRVVLKDKIKNKVLFENPAFTFRSQYDIPEGADITYFDKESVAVEEISKNFAETLISAILEAF